MEIVIFLCRACTSVGSDIELRSGTNFGTLELSHNKSYNPLCHGAYKQRNKKNEGYACLWWFRNRCVFQESSAMLDQRWEGHSDYVIIYCIAVNTDLRSSVNLFTRKALICNLVRSLNWTDRCRTGSQPNNRQIVQPSYLESSKLCAYHVSYIGVKGFRNTTGIVCMPICVPQRITIFQSALIVYKKIFKNLQ